MQLQQDVFLVFKGSGSLSCMNSVLEKQSLIHLGRCLELSAWVFQLAAGSDYNSSRARRDMPLMLDTLFSLWSQSLDCL